MTRYAVQLKRAMTATPITTIVTVSRQLSEWREGVRELRCWRTLVDIRPSRRAGSDGLLSGGAVCGFDRHLDERVRPAAPRTAAAVAGVVVGGDVDEIIARRAEVDLRR